MAPVGGSLLLFFLPALLLPLARTACPYHSLTTTSSSSSGSGRRSLQSMIWTAPPAPPALPTSDSTTSAGYPEIVKNLDLAAVKADLTALLKSSDPAWPSDFGYYGGLFIRLAWHSAGSYRTWDGRGGMDGGRIRFFPEANWPDNTNLDKARALLVPIKEKYNDVLSWGDLIAIAGNTAIEAAGGPKLGLCLGRIDDVDGNASLALGPTKEQDEIAPCTVSGNCGAPLGPTTMGLIYVNPAGPLGVPVPSKSAPQIRDSFGRMGMNDSETVALVGGGHAFGKTHGACPAGPGLCGTGAMKGKGNNTVTSGFEGAWTDTPTVWTNDYYVNLLSYNWTLHTGPGGKPQWKPMPLLASKQALPGTVLPKISMLTADVSLLKDPVYSKLVSTYATNLSALNQDFAAAWYKLLTRDVGYHRCVDVNGTLPPPQDWQCPLPAGSGAQVDYSAVAGDIAAILKEPSTALPPDNCSVGGVTYAGLFATLAWQSASTYRDTDHLGGTNGARIRFPPMANFTGNEGMDKVLEVLQPIKAKYPDISYADLIVLAGYVALNSTMAASGMAIPLESFTGGRVDATGPCVTDKFLGPRKYLYDNVTIKDNAAVMGLSLPEYVALFAIPRSPSHQVHLGYSGSWSPAVEPLSNTFFQTLLKEKWEKSLSNSKAKEYRAQGKQAFLTPLDLALVQDPELKAVVERFSANSTDFMQQVSSGWTKMMNAGVYGTSATKPGVPSVSGHAKSAVTSVISKAAAAACVAAFMLLVA